MSHYRSIKKLFCNRIAYMYDLTHRLLVSAYFLQYLDLLFKKDPHAGQEFHALQVPLFAEFDRPRLLPFLRSSNYYPLQKALDVCQERSLIPEMVFLLGESEIVIAFKTTSTNGKIFSLSKISLDNLQTFQRSHNGHESQRCCYIYFAIYNAHTFSLQIYSV